MEKILIYDRSRFKVKQFLTVILSIIIITSLISTTSYADASASITSVGVPSNGTYARGETLSFTVVFSEAVTVDTTNGTPVLELRIDNESGENGTGEVQSVYALYESGSGTTNLVFRYTVISGFVDSNGIGIYALLLNNGTIKDSLGSDAQTTLNNISDTASVLVNAPLTLSGGNGTSGTPYLISTTNDIEELAEASNIHNDYTGSYFTLNNDINFSGGSIATNKGGIPYFSGYFNGNGNTISNVAIHVSQEDEGNFGLFSTVGTPGKIENLNLKDVSYTVDCKSTLFVGGIAGTNTGTIDSCFVSGTITATNSDIPTAKSDRSYSYAGGISGMQNSSGNMLNCIADITITSTCYDYYAFAGGLSGGNGGTITNCGAYGTVNSYTTSTTNGDGYTSYSDEEADAIAYAGGAAGENTGTIHNSYSTAAVLGQSEDYASYVGGFAGKSSGTISNCYTTAIVTGETQSNMPPYAGGFVGYHTGNISQSYASGDVTTYIDNSICTRDFNGGFVGLNLGAISDAFSAGKFISVVNESTESVQASSGGFAGYHYSGSIRNCYYNSENHAGIGVIKDGEESNTEVYGKSTTELKSYALISGTDSGNGLSWTDIASAYHAGNLWRAANEAAFPIFQNQTYLTQPTTTETINENGKIDVAVASEWTNNKIQPAAAAYIGYRTSGSTDFDYVSASLQSATKKYSTTIENLEPDTDYVFCAVGDGYGQSTESAFTTTDVVLHTITASVTGPGSISPSSPISVPDGYDKTITITADSGQKIDSLSIDSVLQTDAGGTTTYSYTFTNVTADHSVEATFVSAPVTTSSKSSSKKDNNPVDKAMENGKKNEDGKLVGSIEASIQSSQGAYQQDIPADYFENKDKLLDVVTPIATVTMPDNMFTETPNQQVSLSVDEISKDGLPEEARDIIGDKPVIDIYLTVGNKRIEWSNHNVEVKIVIPYEPTEEELNNVDKIIAVYIDDEGNITPVALSSYDSKAGGVVLKVNHFSNYAVQYIGSSFNDLRGYKWAAEAIEALSARDIIKGTSKVEFSPQSNITRADFAVLISRFFELDGEIAENFSDVKPGAYYYDAVGIAAKNGILTGKGNNLFCPSEPVSRQDMMVIIKRALEATGQDSKVIAKNETKVTDFSDGSMVKKYAKESVEYLIQAGIVNGDGEKINPAGYTRRAETAVILYRLLDHLNQ